MRYQNLGSFTKHLESASPHNLSRVYLLMIPNDYERMELIRGILKRVSAKENPPVMLSGEGRCAGEVFDALAPSLFNEAPVVVVDELEKMGKKELQALGEGLQGTGYLLLGARGKVPLASAVEKAGVVLDLTEEKPWDRERRLLEGCTLRVSQTGKRMASDAAALLLERVGPDPALLDQEIDKLLCFVGERSTVERADVLRAASDYETATTWQMAEDLVWGDGKKLVISDATFHALLPAIRGQLEMGAKIASLLQVRAPPEDWTRALPKVWPKKLEMMRGSVERRGPAYFEKGLKLLFDLELLSRTGSSSFTTLLEYFKLKMQHVR